MLVFIISFYVSSDQTAMYKQLRLSALPLAIIVNTELTRLVTRKIQPFYYVHACAIKTER